MKDPNGEFAEFVEKVWDRHLRLARLLAADRHGGEELLQDCLVRLYVRWSRQSVRGDPEAYLSRMLVNGNISRWRRRRREHLVDQLPDVADVSTVMPEPAEDLRVALLALPRRQRAVVVLRHYADLTEREVATVLGCAVGTVKSQNAKALARLRTLLDDPHDFSHPEFHGRLAAGPAGNVHDAQKAGKR